MPTPFGGLRPAFGDLQPLIIRQIARMERAFALFSLHRERFAMDLKSIAREVGIVRWNYRHSKEHLAVLTALLEELAVQPRTTDENRLTDEIQEMENAKNNEIRKMERRLNELERDARLLEEEDRWNFAKYARHRWDLARQHGTFDSIGGRLTLFSEEVNEDVDYDTFIRENDSLYDDIMHVLREQVAHIRSTHGDLVTTMQSMRVAVFIRIDERTADCCEGMEELIDSFASNRRNFEGDLKKIAKEASDMWRYLDKCFPNIKGRLELLEELYEQARMTAQPSVLIQEMENKLLDEILEVKQHLSPLEDRVKRLVEQDRLKFKDYAGLRMEFFKDDISDDATLYGLCGRLTRAAKNGEDHGEWESIYDDIINVLGEQVERIRSYHNNKIDELGRFVWMDDDGQP